jgi:hypothetical protein
MELLVAVLHAHQTLDRFLLGRRIDLDGLEARSSDRSFSMYFRYSAGVVAPMHRILPRDSAGLRMLAASSDPSADPRRPACAARR